VNRTTIQLNSRSVHLVIGNLLRINKAVAKKWLNIGLNAAGSPAKAVAQARAAKETGLLQKSMTIKVPHDKNTRIPIGVLVGPGRRKGRFMRLNKAGKLKGFGVAQRALVAERKRLATGKIGKPLERERAAVRAVKASVAGSVYRNPTRYAHLAERKSPAINAAFRTLQTAGVAKLVQKIEQGIAAEPMRS
jgi:hypothetical protein